MITALGTLLRKPTSFMLLGVAVAAIAGLVYLGDEPSFKYRVIGVSVLHGVDVSLRAKIYILGIFGGICFMLAFLLRLKPPKNLLANITLSPKLSVIVATLLGCNLALYVVSENAVFLSASCVLVYLAVMAIFLNRFSLNDHGSNSIWIIIILVYQLTITGYCLAGQVYRFDAQFVAIFTLVLLVSFALFNSLNREKIGSKRIAALAYALSPLVALPLTIVVANEAQYTLLVRFGMAVSSWWVWVVLLGLVACSIVALYLKKTLKVPPGNHDPETENVLGNLLNLIYFPILIGSNVVLTEYSSVLLYTGFHDFFHGGEEIVPIQQFLQFGSIPYIDFNPPHGLFDMFPQLFYQLLNNTADYRESLLWGQGYMIGWLPRSLAAILIYYFLSKFLTHKVAFLILLFLPIYHLIHPYYVFLTLPIYALCNSKGSFGQWLVFWSAVAFLFLWRVDFGIAATVATVFTCLTWRLSNHPAGMIRRSLFALSLVVLISGGLFLFLCFIRQQSPLGVLENIIDYARIITLATAYTEFVGKIDLSAVLQYALLPAFSVIYLSYFLYLIIYHRTSHPLHRVAAFMAVASLVISVRSLNRHSHYEGVFNPYFFVLIAALLPVLIMQTKVTLRAVLFLFVCSASYAALPKSTSFFYYFFYDRPLASQYVALASDRGLVKLHPGPVSRDRVKPKSLGVENTISFLQSYLHGEESFYDFSNSPLLYALAQKKLPSHHMEKLAQVSDNLQNNVLVRLREEHDEGRLPLTIFRQNNSSWDAVDGVNSEITSYRMAEFVYENFVPCVNIDNYEIWLSRKVDVEGSCEDHIRRHWPEHDKRPNPDKKGLNPIIQVPQVFELRQLPYVWANYDDADPITSIADAQDIEIVPVSGWEDRQFELQILQVLASKSGSYIHLKIRSEKEGVAELSYANGNGFRFDILSGGARDYLIRVSAQHAWYKEEFQTMLLRSEFSIELLSARFLPGD
tara:strand:- start:233 stop:3136 length:2904 start_codon:yes stop_codon:yes gene_type:complete